MKMNAITITIVRKQKHNILAFVMTCLQQPDDPMLYCLQLIDHHKKKNAHKHDKDK